jgi:alginate O-acetyltransferase complex protein AlgI
MVFNSVTFLFFFTLVLFFHNLPFSWKIKKLNLLLASYIFYCAWNPFYVSLLILSAFGGWVCAKFIGKSNNNKIRKLFLITGICINLGFLAFFKYADFLLTTFIDTAAVIGVKYSAPEIDIILPLGISFFTFQTMSYVIDVYRKEMGPSTGFLDFSLYVSFFPQLVAGPIVRSGHFLPQLDEPKQTTKDQLGWGLVLLLIGLFEKQVLADGLMALVANPIFDSWKTIGIFDAWVGVFAFSGQIFFDFAGYSTCAIGVALCLGFVLPDNFRFPYASLGFSDFWRRWHISLSTWLRDYLYIPLGGNRKGPVRTYVNLMLTMLVGGLWHGASWSFVVWGGLHGLYLAIERLIKSRYSYNSLPDNIFIKFCLVLFTYIVVSVTWVFFRADTFECAIGMLSAMIGFSEHFSNTQVQSFHFAGIIIATIGLFSVHYFLRDKSIEEVFAKLPWWLIGVMLAVMMVLILLAPGEKNAFIYFQF